MVVHIRVCVAGRTCKISEVSVAGAMVTLRERELTGRVAI